MVRPRRQPVSTVAFIDNYCQHYYSLFEDVRHFEAFKFLHLGILSEIPRKTLPLIAKTVGLKDSQTLHHFLRDALWDVKKLREIRLYNRWKAYEQKLSHRQTETRDLREIIFGKRRRTRYYQISKINTPDPTGDESWYIMTNLSTDLSVNVAQLYSLRNWIEYGFKQVKNELGWADFRLTDYESIERWWEIIFSAYLLVSIQATYFQFHAQTQSTSSSELPSSIDFNCSQHSQHPNWEHGTTWKSALNNLRLIIQPYIFYCLIQSWLTVFHIPGMKRCFLKLINFMNDFRASPLSFLLAS